uniref:Uncharacterized protein n=1 Tax=Cannabis sativa TaxID=3483 RepID=A0A803QRD3_CANSA
VSVGSVLAGFGSVVGPKSTPTTAFIKVLGRNSDPDSAQPVAVFLSCRIRARSEGLVLKCGVGPSQSPNLDSDYSAFSPDYQNQSRSRSTLHVSRSAVPDSVPVPFTEFGLEIEAE